MNSAFSQDKKFNYQANTSPSVNNKLSIFLQNNFSKKELKKVSYNHAQNNIILSFYLNEKLEVFDIDVSTKNPEIDKKLEDVFIKFPIQELNINTPSPSKKYSLQIISKVGKKTNSIVVPRSSKKNTSVVIHVTPTNNLMIKSCVLPKQFKIIFTKP